MSRAPKFQNLDPAVSPKGRGAEFFKWFFWQRLTGVRPRDPRYPRAYRFPLLQNDGTRLRANRSRPSITFIGQSTLLLQLAGTNVLTDPNYASSIWTRKRITPPGISFDKLPAPDIILISHNHYDHLHAATVRRLGTKPRYLVPLGLKGWFKARGIVQVRELDWWQSAGLGKLKITFVPAQHFSRRGLLDTNRSLWGGWVIEGGGLSVYFAGDSGYFKGFKLIGRRFPALDVALLPIGAYDPPWFMRPMHLDPEEALQAFRDLGAKYFVPIHWGTFKLSDEALDEPLLRLQEGVRDSGLDEGRIWLLKHGQTRFIDQEEI